MDQYSLTQSVAQCAKEAAVKSRAANMSALWDHLVNMDVPQVLGKIEQARQFGWYGAVPASEPVHLIKASAANPLATIGIDGSQIYPEPDSPVRWAFAQAVRFRSGEKASLKSQFFSQTDLIQDELSQSAWLTTSTVDNLRTLLELDMAYLAAMDAPECVVLVDNPLVPFENYGPSQNEWFQNYVLHLKKLDGMFIAGYVSNPKSGSLPFKRVFGMVKGSASTVL